MAPCMELNQQVLAMADINGTGGNDSLTGTSSNDTIKGGAGHDTIMGGAGEDQLEGGAGNDSILGGAGDDTLDGGDGNDTLIDDSGNNSLSGGEGDDRLTVGGSGSHTLDGGAGNDSLVGGSGGDSISGGDGADTILANEGDDTLSGGAGNDRIVGDEGNDLIDAGAGDDVVFGGGGMDTIEGGGGNDHLFGGAGADTFVIRDGHGADTIGDFRTSEDIIAFDMNEIRSYDDIVARISGTQHATITFNNGDSITVSNVRPENLRASNFAFTAGPVCLLAGTPIRTERGDIPIEELRPDDILWTKDHGWQALRLVVMETMVFKHRDDPAKPILIPMGALGAGQPDRDLILSPQHRVLQMLDKTGEEVLVPAVKLIGHKGIRRMRGKQRAEYLNVVMERHSIIQAAGCWVESLLVTSQSLSRQTKAARRLLDHAKAMTPARRIEKRGVRPRHLKSA